MKEASFGSSRLVLVRADITKLAVDAIVNAANSSLAGGGGVDGAIHRAGGPQIMEQCRKIGRCETGNAVITFAGNLRARYVIHAVAPRYRGRPKDAEYLSSAYLASLRLAEASEARSIAFPSLGTGAYGYPIAEASAIALSSVTEYLRNGSRIEHVTFALFSSADLAAYETSLRPLVVR
jgi:O-acetyl-ADP-ribose deacetylase (regulator of RNase III)